MFIRMLIFNYYLVITINNNAQSLTACVLSKNNNGWINVYIIIGLCSGW